MPRVVAVIAGLGLALQPVSAEDVAPVTIVAATLSPIIEEVRLTGTVTAEHSASLSPRVSGLVSIVNVDAGDRVVAGQVLLELDSTLAELALRRAEGALGEARVRLAEAERLRDEARELVRGRNVPETQLHAAEAEVRINAAVVARLEAAQREQAEVVARHALIAPFAGVVSRKLTEAGEWVETGTAVLELVALNRLRVDVQMPQERHHEINTDTPVTVRLDALPGRPLHGRIATKVPVKDPSARTFLVRVLIDAEDGLITPGMSAHAVFRVPANERALTVPRDAIVRQPDGTSSVWVLNEVDGTLSVSEQRVELGRSVADAVEVRAGLEAGRRVVLRGNERLREGQSVRVLAAD